MRSFRDRQPDFSVLLQALGRLWLAGVKVDWQAYFAHERRRRVPLPAYPFERQRYWVEPRALVREGAYDDGEAVAREALEAVAQTDALELRGTALLDLAEVLRAAGSEGEAESCTRDGLALFEQKGIVVLSRPAARVPAGRTASTSPSRVRPTAPRARRGG